MAFECQGLRCGMICMRLLLYLRLLSDYYFRSSLPSLYDIQSPCARQLYHIMTKRGFRTHDLVV